MATRKISATITPRRSQSKDTIEKLSCRNYRIVQPIEVTVELVEDGYLVSDVVTHQYGVGKTKAEAKEDYLRTLIDYSEISIEHRERLAEDIQQHLAFITSHLSY